MIAEYLKSIPGIEVFGVAGLVGTFAAFVGVVVWALRIDRPTITRMSQLPLEEASGKDIHSTER